jgi:hypothetical protein
VKRLTKTDSDTQESLIRNLREKADAVSEVWIKINAMIADELNPAIAEYNGILNDADEFRNEIVGRMDDYANARSEKWTESETGQNFISWQDEWEQLDFQEMPDVPEMDFDGFDAADDLEAANTGPTE